MTQKNKATALLHVSDTHSGLMAGLIAPKTKVTLDDAKTREIGELSAWSTWVWSCYDDIIRRTVEIINKTPLFVIHTGDIIHGSKYPEYLYSVHTDQQVEIAAQALGHLRKIPTLVGWYLLHGTGSHDYGQASGTRQLAATMAAWGKPVEALTHALVNFDGSLVDAAHHGPGVGQGIDYAAQVRGYVIRYMRKHLERGLKTPAAILRGHVHTNHLSPISVPWGLSEIETTMSISPPLCGPNEYARQYTRSTPITVIGANLLILCGGKVVERHPLWYEHDNRQSVTADLGVITAPRRGGGKTENKA